jgi:hypothetical protein
VIDVAQRDAQFSFFEICFGLLKCAFSHSAHQQILIPYSACGGAHYVSGVKQKSIGEGIGFGRHLT